MAAEPALPWPAGSFVNSYAGNRAAANELALEASSVAAALQAFIKEGIEWEGTATELLVKIENVRYTDAITRNRPGWPKSARALSNQLRRIAPTLRRIGVEVTMGNREGRDRRRIIHLVYVQQTSSASSATSTSASQDAGLRPFMTDADGANDELPIFFNVSAELGVNAENSLISHRRPWRQP